MEPGELTNSEAVPEYAGVYTGVDDGNVEPVLGSADGVKVLVKHGMVDNEGIVLNFDPEQLPVATLLRSNDEGAAMIGTGASVTVGTDCAVLEILACDETGVPFKVLLHTLLIAEYPLSALAINRVLVQVDRLAAPREITVGVQLRIHGSPEAKLMSSLGPFQDIVGDFDLDWHRDWGECVQRVQICCSSDVREKHWRLSSG